MDRKSHKTRLWTNLWAPCGHAKGGFGGIVGVLVAMTLFARRVAYFTQVEREILGAPDRAARAVHTVRGELFFASSNDLYTQFEYGNDPALVGIDLSLSHVWDASTVDSLDSISIKYASKDKRVEIHGLNAASASIHSRLSGQLSSG